MNIVVFNHFIVLILGFGLMFSSLEANSQSLLPGQNKTGESKPKKVEADEPPKKFESLGRSTEQPKALSEEEKKPYKYNPYKERFWKQFNEFLSDKEYANAIKFASRNMGKQSTNIEKEAYLALAIALDEAGFPAFSGLLLFDIISNSIGSRVSELALRRYDLLARKKMVDQIDLESLLVGQEIIATHWENKAFLSAFRASYALKFGLIDWYKAELPNLVEESYWFHQFEYLKALGLIARNQVTRAYDMIKAMVVNEAIVDPLKQTLRKQHARILFEERRFEKAIDIYESLKVPLREWGRIILEQAWAYYYLKKFDKSLGLLQALKTRYLSASPSIESHLLEMIIYKDLCHYDRVEAMASVFRKDFKKAFKKIKGRKPLRSSPRLAKIALIDNEFQGAANLVSKLRQERRDMAKLTDGFKVYDSLIERAKLKEKEIEFRLDSVLESKVRSIANELLDIEEQVLFLDYTAKLDALRLRVEKDEVLYRAEKKSLTSFEKIYWPIDREKWLDELKDYKVLLKNKCIRNG